MSNINYEKSKEFLDKVFAIIEEHKDSFEELSVEAKIILGGAIGNFAMFQTLTEEELNEFYNRLTQSSKDELKEAVYDVTDNVLLRLEKLIEE
jgi:hypothetical protein